MKIIHLVTRVQAMFGLVDDEGNVTENYPINLEIHRFTAAAYLEAQQTVAAEREKLVKTPPPTAPRAKASKAK